MENIAEIPAQACAMPRFEDGAANLQELIRRLAEDVANGIMDAEADQMREATGNSRTATGPTRSKRGPAPPEGRNREGPGSQGHLFSVALASLSHRQS